MTHISLTWLKAAAGVWFLKNKRRVVSSALVLFLSASVGLGGYYSVQPHTTVFDNHQQNGGFLQSGEPAQAPAGPLATKSQAPVGQPSDTSSQQKNTNQNSTSGEQSDRSQDVLRVNAVQLNGAAVVCHHETGMTRVRITSAALTLNTVHTGGTLRWQWETEGSLQGMENTQSTSAAITETIPEGAATYTINPADNGFLYSNNGYPIQGYKIRLKVVAPHETASPWLTIPAGIPKCTP